MPRSVVSAAQRKQLGSQRTVDSGSGSAQLGRLMPIVRPQLDLSASPCADAAATGAQQPKASMASQGSGSVSSAALATCKEPPQQQSKRMKYCSESSNGRWHGKPPLEAASAATLKQFTFDAPLSALPSAPLAARGAEPTLQTSFAIAERRSACSSAARSRHPVPSWERSSCVARGVMSDIAPPTGGRWVKTGSGQQQEDTPLIVTPQQQEQRQRQQQQQRQQVDHRQSLASVRMHVLPSLLPISPVRRTMSAPPHPLRRLKPKHRCPSATRRSAGTAGAARTALDTLPNKCNVGLSVIAQPNISALAALPAPTVPALALVAEEGPKQAVLGLSPCRKQPLEDATNSPRPLALNSPQCSLVERVQPSQQQQRQQQRQHIDAKPLASTGPKLSTPSICRKDRQQSGVLSEGSPSTDAIEAELAEAAETAASVGRGLLKQSQTAEARPHQLPPASLPPSRQQSDRQLQHMARKAAAACVRRLRITTATLSPRGAVVTWAVLGLPESSNQQAQLSSPSAAAGCSNSGVAGLNRSLQSDGAGGGLAAAQPAHGAEAVTAAPVENLLPLQAMLDEWCNPVRLPTVEFGNCSGIDLCHPSVAMCTLFTALSFASATRSLARYTHVCSGHMPGYLNKAIHCVLNFSHVRKSARRMLWQVLVPHSGASCPSVDDLMEPTGGAIRPVALCRRDLEHASFVGQVKSG